MATGLRRLVRRAFHYHRSPLLPQVDERSIGGVSVETEIPPLGNLRGPGNDPIHRGHHFTGVFRIEMQLENLFPRIEQTTEFFRLLHDRTIHHIPFPHLCRDIPIEVSRNTQMQTIPFSPPPGTEGGKTRWHAGKRQPAIKTFTEPTAEWGWKENIAGAETIPPGMTPNTFSLVSVSTREEKRGVDVTFSNEQRKQTKFYPFFPSFYLPHTSTTAFERLLDEHFEERHQLIAHPSSIQVIAGTWKDLKHIAHRLHGLTNYFPSLIEPERQFLLTQKWRYFQSFDAKLNPLPETFQETRMEGMTEGVFKTLRQVHTHRPELEHSLIRRMIISHELGIPPSEAGELSPEIQMETLLENHFFTLHQSAPLQKGKKVDRGKWNMEQRTRANAHTWEMGTEGEGKCACCTPTSLAEAHVQGGSEVECIVEQDGVYLHTLDEERSHGHHAKRPHPQKRIHRAKEWGLHTLPIGPLWRGEKITLSLSEAQKAHEEGLLHMTFTLEPLRWTCRKNPPALTQLHATLSQREEIHSTRQNALIQPYLTQYQLAYALHTPTDPWVTLHTQGEKILREWKERLPHHLQTGETAWRDPHMGPQWKAILE